MSSSRKALLALTGFAALAMPLAVAGSASAATNPTPPPEGFAAP